MWREGCQFVAKDTIDTWNLNRQVLAFCDKQIILYRMIRNGAVRIFFKNNIKKDAEFFSCQWRLIEKSVMAFFNFVLANTHIFFRMQKWENTSCIYNILIYICTWRNNDIDIC